MFLLKWFVLLEVQRKRKRKIKNKRKSVNLMVLQPLEGERIDELRNWLLFFFVAEGQRQDLRHWVLLLLLSFVAEAREKGFDALGDVCVLLRKERKRQDLTHWEWDRYTRSICWVRASTNAAHARHMRQIMLTSFPSHLMGVMVGPTSSTMW